MLTNMLDVNPKEIYNIIYFIIIYIISSIYELILQSPRANTHHKGTTFYPFLQHS